MEPADDLNDLDLNPVQATPEQIEAVRRALARARDGEEMPYDLANAGIPAVVEVLP